MDGRKGLAEPISSASIGILVGKRRPRIDGGRPPIRFFTADIFDFHPPVPIDIVISSLFTHHLDDSSLFDSWLDGGECAISWFVNDLHRHPSLSLLWLSRAR